MTYPTLSEFYITGGTVPRDAACYVPRQADVDLLEGLRRGEFCYVLTPRQMGKSSLMVRTATKLRQEGVTCASLDLTAIGQNLDAERWYGGLINQLGQQVGLEDEIDDAWLAPSSLGPLQRWLHCLNSVVLKKLGSQTPEEPTDANSSVHPLSRSHSLVIFIDEIDAVRSLPFSADEFFASIRQCYNRRAENPEFNRLTFCLLGVATPTDLIRDTRTTPFNIGRRIELTDFTYDEARVLALGFGYRLDGEQVFLQAAESEMLLRRVLYWTGGHPYLTQRLCKALGDNAALTRPDTRLVDHLCRELFLEAGARERDDNLLFVRERLLRGTEDLNGLLQLYRQVWDRKQIPVDETDPLFAALRLSGIARVSNGRLKPRNRIYDYVFNERWVRANMPGAELRRQKAAYLRGVGTALSSAAIVVIVVALTIYALQQHQTSEIRFQQVLKEQQIAEQARDEVGLIRYIGNMNEIQKDWDARPVQMERMQELLEETKFSKFRGIEWGIWYRRCHLDLHTLNVSREPVAAVAFSPDGKTILTGSQDDMAGFWEVSTGKEIGAPLDHKSNVTAVAFSPDGNQALTGSNDTFARIWDVQTHRMIHILERHTGYVTSVAFSPNGRFILTGSRDNTAILWDAKTSAAVHILKGHSGGVVSVAFSNDGKYLLTGSEDSTAKIWDAATGKVLRTISGHMLSVSAVAFSPDGKRIAIGGDSKKAILQTVAAGEPIFLNHSGLVTSVAFSRDGKYLLTGSDDSTAKMWDAVTGKELRIITGHRGSVTAVAFSWDGTRILTGGHDGAVKLWQAQLSREIAAPASSFPESRRLFEVPSSGTEDTDVKIWDATSGREIRTLAGHAGHLTSITVSPDGRYVLTAGYRGVAELWEANTGRNVRSLTGHAGAISSVAFSPNGRRILTGGMDKKVNIWTVDREEEIDEIKGHTGAVSSVAFSPDGHRILTGSRDATARISEVAKPHKQLGLLHGHDGPISSVAFSPDGRWILTGSEDATALLWEAQSGKVVHALAGQSGPIASVAFSRDGSHILTGSWDHTVWLWNAHTGEIMGKIDALVGPVFSVAFSPDGSRILAGGATSGATLWEKQSGVQKIKMIRMLKRAAAPVAFSPDGRRILTGSHSANEIRYDNRRWGTTGIEMLIVKANAGPVTDVEVSPDLKQILTGSRDGTATLWDRANPGRTKPLKGHTGPVTSVAFSPDGTRLLTGSEDTTVKLWDTSTAQELLTLKSNAGPIVSVEFSTDGSSIRVTSRDNTVRIWSAY